MELGTSSSLCSIRKEVEKEGEVKQLAQVFNHIFGFVNSLVLKSAIELGIFDSIHATGKPKITLSTLAAILPLPPSINLHSLRRLLRYLVHMGLLRNVENEGEEEYSLTELAVFLLREGEKSLGTWALAVIHEVDMDCWYDLGKCCYTPSSGPTIFESKHGMKVWEFTEMHEEVNGLINEAMTNDTKAAVPAFIRCCGEEVFKGVGSVVDVGGGTGMAMRMVAEAFPLLSCTAFDLPHVVATAPSYPNVVFVGGDMFESVPNADAVLLKSILHNWRDDGCIRILERCKEAVPRDGGKVIIIDIIMDSDDNDDDDDLVGSKICLDIDMLVTAGGKERTADEWEMLIKKAGFRSLEIFPIQAVQSVIVAYP